MSSKSWTTEERLVIWKMFLDWSHKEADCISVRMTNQMALRTGKTQHACVSELWKIYRSNREGPTYWNQADRLLVVFPGRRDHLKFTLVDDHVITKSTESGIPITRIAELLGREAFHCLQRLQTLQGRDRPNFGLIRENEDVGTKQKEE